MIWIENLHPDWISAGRKRFVELIADNDEKPLKKQVAFRNDFG
jgi:hypothetical protein